MKITPRRDWDQSESTCNRERGATGQLSWFSLIPNWQELKLTCDFCGTTESVKYRITDRYPTTYYACNRCVLLRGFAKSFFKL